MKNEYLLDSNLPDNVTPEMIDDPENNNIHSFKDIEEPLECADCGMELCEKHRL